MQELIAKNDKQLAAALKLAYAEKVKYGVEVHESEKRKIYYAVTINCDADKFVGLHKRYQIMFGK